MAFLHGTQRGGFKAALRRCAASVVLLATGLTSVAQAGPSGLPWQSGSACIFNEFAAWRTRPLDIQLTFGHHETWAQLVQHFRGGYINQFAAMPGGTSVSLALLTDEVGADPDKFTRCSGGAFDRYFRDIAASLKGKGLGDSYIRLGWEAGNGSHPWFVGTQVDGYKKCWRRIANLLKSISPSFKLEWVNARRGEQTFDVRTMYPGDDVVDVIGVHNYDRYPSYPNQAAWDKAYYSTTEYGQPRGMGAWLDWAKSRGKKLAISEWGVSNGHGGVDNPFYIKKMYEFFGKNAAHIEYEAYFNCQSNAGKYHVFPTTANPLAAAEYQRLWGGVGS